MNATHKRRLLKLADFMATVRPKRFDIYGWNTGESDNPANNGCGTTACAAGWAASIHSFRRAGFSCNWSGPSFRGARDTDALRAFFGTDRPFFSRYYDKTNPTPKDVARLIRGLVAAQAEGLD